MKAHYSILLLLYSLSVLNCHNDRKDERVHYIKMKERVFMLFRWMTG